MLITSEQFTYTLIKLVAQLKALFDIKTFCGNTVRIDSI